MKIKSTKVGDVFVANIENKYKKYLQYVVSDMEQLNSDVIRFFKREYSLDCNPSLEDIVSDDVDFYTHTTTKTGIKFEFWNLIGNINEVGDVENLSFRGGEDSGDSSVTISKKWNIWKVNKPHKYVGRLKGKNQNAEIGLIYAPENVIKRIITGIDDAYYPRYE